MTIYKDLIIINHRVTHSTQYKNDVRESRVHFKKPEDHYNSLKKKRLKKCIIFIWLKIIEWEYLCIQDLNWAQELKQQITPRGVLNAMKPFLYILEQFWPFMPFGII